MERLKTIALFNVGAYNHLLLAVCRTKADEFG